MNPLGLLGFVVKLVVMYEVLILVENFENILISYVAPGVKSVSWIGLFEACLPTISARIVIGS